MCSKLSFKNWKNSELMSRRNHVMGFGQLLTLNVISIMPTYWRIVQRSSGWLVTKFLVSAYVQTSLGFRNHAVYK